MIKALLRKITFSHLWSKTNKQKIANELKEEDYATKDVMDIIYKNKLWGGGSHDFYSGAGSHSPKIVQPYIACLIEFFGSLDEKITICDLGCGDFNVGNQLVEHSQKYIGVDIVDDLIQRNKELFHKDNLEFHCINIVNENLPEAECVLVRQVLQHLTNDEVAKVLGKLKNYKYVIITEHVPFGKFTPNKDKKTGPGTRLSMNSGIDIAQPPFSFDSKIEKELLRLNFGKKKTQIVTTLYQNIE